VPRDGRDPAEVEFEKPTLLIVGGEGAGLDAEVVSAADAQVSVPMRQGVESLNVGVAAALLLDAARRRRAVSRQP
jgi:TrmH family RNA methyltransferase